MSKKVTIPEENIIIIEEYTNTFLYVNPWFNVNIPCTTQEKILDLIDKLEKLNYEQQIKEVISFEGGFNPYLKLHSDDLQLKVSGVSRCTVSAALNFKPINKDECRIYNKVVRNEIEAINKDCGLYLTFEECKNRFETFAEIKGINREILASNQVRLIIDWFSGEDCANIDFIYGEKGDTGGRAFRDHLAADGGGCLSCDYEGKKLFDYLYSNIHLARNSGEDITYDGINYDRFIQWDYHIRILNIKEKIKYLIYLISIRDGLEKEPKKSITDLYPELTPDHINILRKSLHFSKLKEFEKARETHYKTEKSIQRTLEEIGRILNIGKPTAGNAMKWAMKNRDLLSIE